MPVFAELDSKRDVASESKEKSDDKRDISATRLSHGIALSRIS